VALETFKVSQISFIELLESLTIDFAIEIFLVSINFGLPPILPLALAALSPTFVLSIIISRSNSAREANI
jgi:hypothetical protein